MIAIVKVYQDLNPELNFQKKHWEVIAPKELLELLQILLRIVCLRLKLLKNQNK